MSSVEISKIETQYAEKYPLSQQQAMVARDVFPNGVTHDSRHHEPFPVCVSEVHGCTKNTLEGHQLIDFWMGHGALLLGHGHPDVVQAVQQQVERGTHYSASHELEEQWGRMVLEMIPSAEKLRFTSSGTEATLMALRIARIATGRSKVLKLAGHFHGWHDQLILAADSVPADGDWRQPGITAGVHGDLVVVPPNEINAVEQAILEHQPACVILEPTGGRWGVVPIRDEYLRALREVTSKSETLLIFDEVITGFRVSPGGAQQEYGVTPDLTTLAKVLAGGLPGGCLTGRADLLDYLEYDHPSGLKMKHPGTFNGNPLSASAGIAALKAIKNGEACRQANEASAYFRQGLNEMFADKNVNWVAYGDFSLTKILPNYEGDPPRDDQFLPYKNDEDRINRPVSPQLTRAFRSASLLHGVDLMGWGAIMSCQHTEEILQTAIQGLAEAIDLLKTESLVP
ncbi:MAG: aminotransferase class III-fold pyridoxal phosphate-dependent enzyme [Planctomycetaceae bacterium]|nr:aminotransferase class III-fold pyridoxal phosphate-dependent enzyme [Planctomycetaceae bacterium]